ncbi:MAG: NAD(P)/FAD-dependent oxidoreductase [Gammaproteobacteria bacterium]|nr:NAD(P)/FAD-dependent oxidoreductase [Gammaproteobacteria bacterium]
MKPEYFDVVIVGAGLSGIGAACHLQDDCPDKSYVIFEGRAAMGGTWDLFRYPGIRSDSDMHTLGYNFKPWRESKAIADGPSILNYVRETAAEHDIERHIRYGHRIVKAIWSSEEACWTLEARRPDTNQSVSVRCNLLLMCSGYYRYERGHTPEFKGRERFQGPIVHPQLWPQDLDYRDKKVVVVGSGATAMTLVPEMAKKAAHITMLQRSPTYVLSQPDTDWIANTLGKVLPAKMAYAITRWKNITIQQWIYRRTRTSPDKVKRTLLKWVRKELGKDYDVDKHFTPDYNPWDQRLCLVPNGDLFVAIRSGKVSVVTDQIDTFVENGIRLQSGTELDADIIITATGLDLLVLGGVQFTVDGEAVDFSETYTYKGIMSSGVPNMMSTFGYINASWTLRADLTAEYFCRVVNHMDAGGYRQFTPRLRAEDREMKTQPWITGFSPGYMQRGLGRLPKQGDREPWVNPQNYQLDKKMFLKGDIDDGELVFR